MSEVIKLNPKDHAKAREISASMRKIVQRIANLEIQKHKVLKEYDRVAAENAKFEKLLTKKFGENAIIDPDSGIVKTQEQLVAEAQAASENNEPIFSQ